MARDVEDLVLSISADTAQIRRALKRLEGDTKRSTSVMERNFATMNARVSQSAVAMGRSLAVAFAGAVTLRGAQQLIDSSIRIQNALKTTGLEGQALSNVYDQLFASAQRNAAPIESLVTLYSRLAINQKELNTSSAELVQFSDTIALALRAGGTSAAEASGALLQLSQALGGGVVRAEEFNSILEGAPTIAMAAAAGIKEAGGSVAELRKLMIDGAISSEAFFRGIEAGSGILEDKLAGAERTVSQSFVRLQNVLIDTAGKLDEGSGASERLGGALDALADTIAATDFSPLINGLLNVGEAAARVLGTIIETSRAIGELTGANQIGEMIRNTAEANGQQSAIADRIGGAFEATAGTGIGSSGPTVVDVGRRVTPISLSDYAAPASSSGGGRGRGGGGRARAGGRDAAAAAAQREADAVRELISDLEHERELIGQTDTQRSISEALRRAGAAATEEQRGRITELITAIEQEEAAMERLADQQQEVNDLARDVVGGMISDLQSGASAADVLENALSRVADRLIDISLNSIFGGGGGGGLLGGGGGRGGLLGGAIIPGILHQGGVAGRDGYGHGRAVSPSVFSGAQRYHKGGIAGLRPGEVPAILQRGEVVIPKGAKASGGSTHITVGVDVDNSGNLTPFVTSISDQRATVRSQQAMQQSARQFPQLQQDRQRRKG